MSSPGEAVVAAVTEQVHAWPRSPHAQATRMSAKLYPCERLFSPITVNRLTIPNRIVMGPMGNLGMADADGRPTVKMIAYFAERAKGGAGLITTGLVPVSPRIDPSVEYSGAFPRLGSTRQVMSGWRDLASAVHAHGARFFVQLSAGLGRVGSPECLRKGWRMPVSASFNRNYYVPQVPCRPLTDRECRRIIADMGQAAADARECGIDGVYLHGHEGYLLEQFANPAFNRRRFGRYADWQAFGRDCVTEIRQRCGSDYPIVYRIDLALALRATYGARMDSEPILRRVQDIVPCIGDHDACLSEIVHGGHIQCAVTPRTGFEEQAPMRPATRRQRVAVVGAGPAGIVCACLAAERGHDVILFEQDQRLGGLLRAGSVPAIKFDIVNYLAHLEHRVQQTADQKRT